MPCRVRAENNAPLWIWFLAVASLFIGATACSRSEAGPSRGLNGQLASLPYLAETEVAAADRGKLGVTVTSPRAEKAGLNVYCSERNRYFSLLDMAGKVARRVKLPGFCWLVEPFGDEFLVLHRPRRSSAADLSRIRSDGSVAWTTPGPMHHDVTIQDDRTVVALAQQRGTLRYKDRDLPVINDEIWTVDLESGAIRAKLPLAPLLEPLVLPSSLDALHRDAREGFNKHSNTSDLYHTNSIQVLPHDTEFARKGDYLLSSRHLDLVFVVAADGSSLRWSWGRGELEAPHHPTLQPDGTILLFDNGAHTPFRGQNRGYSRVLRVSPPSGDIVWRYEHPRPPVFFSETRGSAQTLSNGNILVAESDRGRWFEVTPDGVLAWEFWTRDSRKEEADGTFMRATTYRVLRLPVDDPPGENPALVAGRDTARTAAPVAR